MKTPHLSRRLIAGTYRMLRILVRLIFVLAVVLVVLFVYLRLYGVPGPILREVVRRVNAAGIPISVEGIVLASGGWRADHVCCYSNHPDDLAPIFQAERVFFKVRPRSVPDGLRVETAAEDIRVVPSVAWGIEMPMDSGFRKVDRVKVELTIGPDGIVISNGKMEWLGCRFSVNGSVLKEMDALRFRKQRSAIPPVQIGTEQFQALEDHLKMLSVPGGALIDIDFEVDTENYSASWVDFSVSADGLAYRNVGFSGVEVCGSYAYPALKLERAGLFDGKQSLQLSGEYNLETRKTEGTLFNSITSNRLMMLFPGSIQDLLNKAHLRIDYLPRLEISFGPAAARELLNHVSGAFSIRGVGYQGVEIETLRGQVGQKNNRIEFTNLQGLVLGQESRAEEAGSAMHGGTAEGSVFWDGNTREFGIDADISFDPNLLVQALSPVKIANTVIQYFNFKDQPPHGHLELGANVDDWRTFYIDIQAVASDVAFRGVDVSSVNVTQTYRHGKLGLDPIAVLQDSAFAKGAVEVDFRNDVVSFDVESSLAPAALEDMIFPKLDLFGKEIKTEGDVRVVAQGVADWGSMELTDFSAMVAAEKLEIPVGVANAFRAQVVGEGPQLSVQDASFKFYGGAGDGRFGIHLDPAETTMPYEFDASFAEVDFKKLVGFFSTDEVDVSGRLSGNIRVEADMATNFFSVASGKASIRVDDGQLADLPLFSGFTKLMRKMIPNFSVFSITSLKGDFTIEEGAVSSEKVSFLGNVISASGRGSYHPESGLDANVQTHILREGGISKVVRTITDPLMKFFEMKVTGPLPDPSWRLEKLPHSP